MRLLNFYMETCQPCKKMHPIAEEAAKEQGYTLEKIDAETEQAEKYDVTEVPTFIVLDGKGTELSRKTGAMSKKAFKKWLKEILPW